MGRLPEGGWWLVVAAIGLAALVPVIWAIVDVLRRPSWQFPTARKVLWVIMLVVGWLLLWPLALVVSLLYLLVLRRRLAWPAGMPAAAPPVNSVPPPQAPPTALPPAGWYPDPSGVHGQRWWDGRGWSPHVR